jgi:hypothetical protein
MVSVWRERRSPRPRCAGATIGEFGMPGIRIPYDALVLIGDGKKAIFYRNKGDGELPNLIVEQVMTQDDV